METWVECNSDEDRERIRHLYDMVTEFVIDATSELGLHPHISGCLDCDPPDWAGEEDG
jgi:hypothetical protein